MNIHAEAQASGLPFPPLLRKELFDKRGLPEWYCPTQRARSLAPALLVAGSALAMASLLFAATRLTHSRQHRLTIEMQAPSLYCVPASAQCSALFLLPSGMHGARVSDVDGYLGRVLMVDGISLPVRVVDTFPAGPIDLPMLRIAWQGGRPPTGQRILMIDETRPLLAWVAPKLSAWNPGERTP
ncbi:hypothetical protein [[Pseudomonas] boreopolis]|uniref:hypothetical protein n=1 Tax=Xanthomonas boreopolis TaxID=86183 RepID=UPI003D9B2F2E